jgi:Cu(I)/Ag(I) efflux system membrane fusion protein
MVRLPKASAIAVLVAVAAAAGIWSVTGAQSQAYKFDTVSDEISVGEGVRIEVRLLDPSGKPVPAGVIDIVSTRLDMGPDGMAMMDTPLTPVPVDSADVMAFETKIVMAGRWALTIEVEVDGVPAPVKGVVIYTAVEKKADATPAAPAAGDRKIRYYRNPMGLPDISPVPKKDSMGMDYIPVYEDELAGTAGTVRVSVEKMQRAGVRTVAVERRDLVRSIRGAGTVMADEARVTLVTARFDGFVERLDVRTTGGTVTAGEPLLRAWIESDELLRKQADYLSALSRGGRDVGRAAQNLRLFGISDATIAEMARTRVPARVVTFEAPQAGTILDKPALDGMRFAAGDTLFRIADLSSLWVMAEIAEQDLALVRPGQTAQLSMPAMPGETRAAIVDFVYPDIDRTTRSGRVRLVVPNADGRLKIGHFVRVEIGAPVGEGPALAVPAASVIDDGARQIVFVARDDGLFEPRDVRLGARAGADVEIREGLAAGEEIVTSGIFLIDAESNLQTALSAFTTEAAAP